MKKLTKLEILKNSKSLQKGRKQKAKQKTVC